MTPRFDTVVIGGGIVGTTAAYYLAKAGKRVALVEKGRINGEQSSRNWGAIRTQGRDRSEIPMMLDCLDIWRGIETELGESVDWRQQGQMRVIYDDSMRARSEAFMPVAREFGLTTQLLTPREVAEMLPHYDARDCQGALFTPTDGNAEPEKAAPAFARGAVRFGATILEHTAARAIDLWNERVCGVETEHGRLACDTVVLASGAWTSRLLKPLGIRHPSLWVRGSVGRTGVLPIEMRKLVVWGKCAYRQRPDGRVNIAVAEDGFHDIMLESAVHGLEFLPLAGRNWRNLRFHLGTPLVRSLMGEFADYTTHRTLDPMPDWKGLRKAANHFLAEYPGAGPIKYERAWAGYIDYMPDELPVIQAMQRPDGLFVAAGLSGHGFGIGPIIGRSLSDLIVKGRSDYDLAPFSARRFNPH
ncbi:MAG: FAD-binding oxidoreductase [Mesorhizobium sp.]|uniref:NAD(P)/FAD-dependent oxidoreductase n=1 Tax=Mesorhizobium sp. TaxID=1871066 RepID=UPI000FE835C1|nr:FAD-binding oxidoreductase [Mesorhizobium sp.]RWD52286.1 MAG: FAD-binding oxidoreductase [Mesorhizobium sp.]RWE61943.1 MAG: FAD-binding oxidoreductase [Mesorhizobium sp.]RWF12109.1 MAG: FAD-binding oxidoreductase [Mesorhizobium sp.]RWF22400.1 MAG: FAD-binding oxidoreductase [Mesorhizobium sp.]TIY06957.1 MAG: FAD-binding oxidoreductase [Mesorhizobium sp.]